MISVMGDFYKENNVNSETTRRYSSLDLLKNVNQSLGRIYFNRDSIHKVLYWCFCMYSTGFLCVCEAVCTDLYVMGTFAVSLQYSSERDMRSPLISL